jgi:phosphotransferase system HPr (HPr) family protein
VKIPDGVVVHLRTVTQFVEAASKYLSDIRVSAGGKSVNGKDVLDMLTLLGPGHRELQISAEGSDAEVALRALENLVTNDLLQEEK